MRTTPLSLDHIFYVYAVFDKEGIIRYIGKGHGSRWKVHRKTYCDAAIVKIRDKLNEEEAFDVEKELIQLIGRQLDETGPLINRQVGGGKAVWCTDKTRRLLSELSKRREATKTPEEKKFQATRGSLAARGIDRWINDGVTNKRIRKDDKIPNGWKSGRLCEASKSFKESLAGTKWITNGVDNRRINPEHNIPNGWRFGRSGESPSKGRHQITNGILNKMIEQIDLIPDGWRAGSTQKQPVSKIGNKGWKWINNGMDLKMIPINSELPSGWSYGNHKVNVKRADSIKPQSTSSAESPIHTSDPALPVVTKAM